MPWSTDKCRTLCHSTNRCVPVRTDGTRCRFIPHCTTRPCLFTARCCPVRCTKIRSTSHFSFLPTVPRPPWFLAWRVPQSTKASENNSLNYLSTTISIYTPNHSLPVCSASNAFPSIAARCSVRRTKYQTAPNASALHATFGFIMRLHLKIPTFVKYVLYSTQPSPRLLLLFFVTHHSDLAM